MGESPRFFTVQEANALVPTLQVEFGRVARLRTQIAGLIEAVGGPENAMGVLQDGARPEPGREREAALLRRLAADVAETVARMNELGCLVKDLDAGLVDFLALQGGEPVFLCWQFGEPAVTHWHAVDAGFGGRRPIEGVAAAPPGLLN